MACYWRVTRQCSFLERRCWALVISLIGTLIGYSLFGLAILRENLVLLFVSRMLPGFTGGNIAVIYSSIADVSDDRSKAKNFGLVGMAFGLGFILGPTVGGLLADSSVVSWFDSDTPFWFTAILTFLNIIFVIFNFRETLGESRESRLSIWTGLRNVVISFGTPNLRVIFSVVLLLSLGFSFFTQFFSVYLINEFDYTEKNIGLLYGWIGVWLVFTQGVIVRQLSNHFASDQILKITILTLSLSILILLLPDQDWWFYVINPMVAISQGITAPNLTAVVSSQAGRERQGEVLGINQSMQSLGQAIPPVIAGYLNALSEQLPLMTASALIFAGWIVYLFIFKKRKKRR